MTGPFTLILLCIFVIVALAVGIPMYNGVLEAQYPTTQKVPIRKLPRALFLLGVRAGDRWVVQS